MRALNMEYLGLDEFVLPRRLWPLPLQPSCPFPYIRHEAFFDAVRTIAQGIDYTFHPYDWETGEPAVMARTIAGGASVVVDGVAALATDIASPYETTIFVASDPTTTLQAAIDRGTGEWTEAWSSYFLPSVALYFESEPIRRASIVVRGRGI